MSDLWLLHLNPFLWEGVVFLLFGFFWSFVLSSIHGLPRRILEAL